MEDTAISKKVLFILKRREDFNSVLHSKKGLSTGLYNSASFMNDMLNKNGIDSVLEVAIDNNCIDKLITLHKPTHCIIEALWVVPSKFAVLAKLHPSVTWIIRLHSEMPFMAGEGMALDWIGDYLTNPKIIIGINAPRMLNEISEFIKTKNRFIDISKRIIYLPNYYPQEYKTKEFNKDKYWVDISCFGAIRPLKNHLVQAISALKFANSINKQLRFHINVGRSEMKGEPVLHNLRGLFMQLSGENNHQLIEHDWRDRPEFLELCSKMDIGMQCNFSETFNIVGADLISQGVPLITTNEIPWASVLFNADPNNSSEIAKILKLTYDFSKANVYLNQRNLTKYTNKTEKIWNEYFK